MCGRYAIGTSRLPRIENALGVALPEVAPLYNVAPTQTVPIVRATGRGCYALVEARWGLVPAWSEEPRTAYATFNARAETVATKPVVRAVYRGSCGSLGKAARPIVGARRRLGGRTVRCGGRRLTLIRRRCRRKNRAEPSHRVGESRGDGTSLLVELLVTATLELSEML